MIRLKKTMGYVAFALATIFVISACSLFDPVQLKESLIYLNEAEKYFWWQSVRNAEEYEIYLDEQKIDTVEDNGSTCVFDYSEICVEEDNYTFQIRAIADGYEPSNFSNKISVIIENPVEDSNDEYSINKLTTDNTKGVNDVTIADNMVTWTKIQDATGYVVVTFNNTEGYNLYYTTADFMRLSNLLNVNAEVMAIKVAAVYADDTNLYVSEDVDYYNPLSKGEFTNFVYLFDGGVYDKYIQNDEELRNYAYYNFVNRNVTYDLLVSVKYKNDMLATGATSIYNYIARIVTNAYMETFAYAEGGPSVTSKQSEYGYAYKVTWTLKVTNPTLDDYDETTGMGAGVSKDMGLKQADLVTYYERGDYSDRANDFDNFASDNKFLSVEVETGEQLFWAIEGGFTPVIDDTTSRAYHIYQYAKDVLRDIISDDMNEYQKVLSIFDYLCDSLVYDYYALYDSNTINMNFAAFYLDGVFLDTNKMVVCDGYAKAFSMLCNMEGIDCIRITGLMYAGVTNSGHAWNKVKVDGTWYLVDVTNTEIKGDYATKYGLPQQVPQTEYLAHRLFLVSENEMNYEAFADRPRNIENECKTYYNYYENSNDKVTLLIDSDEDLINTMDYLYAYNYNGLDFAITDTYYKSLAVTHYEEIDGVQTLITHLEDLMIDYVNSREWITTEDVIPNFKVSSSEIALTQLNIGYVFVITNCKIDTSVLSAGELLAYNTFVTNYKAA